MRDFDEERAKAREGQDRKFKILGHELEFRASVRPEVLFDAAKVTPETDPAHILHVADALMDAYLLPESARLWRDVIRTNEEDPVGLSEIMDLMKWIVEVQTGRPISPSSSSSTGDTGNGTSSTDDSSSHLVAVS